MSDVSNILHNNRGWQITSDSSISSLVHIASGPGGLLMLSSFKIDDTVFSVIFNLFIHVLLLTVGIVGMNPGCSVLHMK